MSLLGVSTREVLLAPLTPVYRRILRMRALVMAVAIVLTGEGSAALIALETDGWWRGRVLASRPRGGREWRRVGVWKNSRGDRRGRADVLDLIGLRVIALCRRLLWLLDRVHHGGLDGLWLWVT